MRRQSAGAAAIYASMGLLASTSAVAQTMPPSDRTDAETHSVIVVTGSHLEHDQREFSSSVAIIGADAIGRSGQTNIAEVLRRQPMFSTGLSAGNSNFKAPGNGLNLIDLRGIGSNRTLVLVNGRRFVSGLGGSSSVDINMIPTELIDRVEILTGGASAVYGSDAVAGVVNFILQDRFEGIRLGAQNAISDRGDAGKYRLTATVGTNFADGRGNVWISGNYDDDGGLLSSQRDFAAKDIFGRSIFPAQGAFNLNGTIFNITGSDPSGGGAVLGNDYTYDAAGNLKKGFVQNIDGFNRNGARRIIVPVRRYLLNSGLTLDLSDGVSAYAEATYGKTISASGLEGYAAAGGNPAVDGAGSIDVPGGLAIDNAFIPAPIAAEIAARNSDASAANNVTFINFKRRLGDIFDRSNRNSRETARFAGGLKGGLSERWDWDASYVYGRTTAIVASDTILTSRIAGALDAVNIGGQILCRDPVARAAGCQPLNIFGAGSASRAAIDYLRGGRNVVSALSTTLEQHVVSGKLKGRLFALPGGDVKMVLGAEYRHEKSRDDWDDDTNAGRTLGNFATDVAGSYDVRTAFAEVVVPLLSQQPFAEYLGVDGAIRYEDYSTVGALWSWKVGGQWAPVRDIRFRAAYARASRAPNIGELFAAQSETFPGTLMIDPCNGVTAGRANAFDAACRAIPAIAAAISQGGVFQYSLAELQSINGFDGGNPNLGEETARTITAGIDIAPRFLPALNLSIDYYHIRVAGAVGSQPRDETVKACLLNPDSAACAGLVYRLPNGKITRIDAFRINTGSLLTSGIDVAVNYRQDLGHLGALDLGGRYTRLLKHKRQIFANAPVIENFGQLQDVGGRLIGSGFADRFILDTAYRRNGFEFSWTARYFGKIRDANIAQPVNDVLYHDFRMGYTLDESHPKTVYIGINNAFDRSPPQLPNGQAASGLIGVETAQEYDVIGRYFYAGVTVKF